jgi:hypothetical protein
MNLRYMARDGGAHVWLQALKQVLLVTESWPRGCC